MPHALSIRAQKSFDRRREPYGTSRWLESLAPNTLRAKRSDLDRIWTWIESNAGGVKDYPVPVESVLAYLKAHEKRLAPSTLQRQMATLSREHRTRKLESPCLAEEVSDLLSYIRSARKRRGWNPARKAAIDEAMLMRMVQTLPGRPTYLRDKALLLTAWASGGRSSDDLFQLRLKHVHPKSDESYTLTLPSTKTQRMRAQVPLRGLAAQALAEWLASYNTVDARMPLFPAYSGTGKILPRPLSHRGMRNLIHAIEDELAIPRGTHAMHALRSGFITAAARANIPIPDVMKLTRHRSMYTMLKYYDAVRSGAH